MNFEKLFTITTLTIALSIYSKSNSNKKNKNKNTDNTILQHTHIFHQDNTFTIIIKGTFQYKYTDNTIL